MVEHARSEEQVADVEGEQRPPLSRTHFSIVEIHFASQKQFKSSNTLVEMKFRSIVRFQKLTRVQMFHLICYSRSDLECLSKLMFRSFNL